jgi:glycosyltransferase involved in cell wall biosynthesis
LQNKTKYSKLLVCVLCYNAEKFVIDTINRIPKILKEFSTDILIIDDASSDSSFEIVSKINKSQFSFNLVCLKNPINQKYGGNVKLGITYAIEEGYDAIAFTHADGQYPPELIYDYASLVLKGDYSTVFGSRMHNKKSALKGGMPLYKFFGNICLTAFQNFFLSTDFSEFHSGFRIYSLSALKKVPYEMASNYFDFDTDVTLQFLSAGLKIKEMPIPTKYGEEVSRVNVFYYGFVILKTTIVYLAHLKGVYYERKFDLHANDKERSKLKQLLINAKNNI